MIGLSLVWKFVLLIIFLAFSAFFSASETALFSLDSIKLRRLSQGGKDTSFIIKLLESPMHHLTAILAGNTLANIAASALITYILIEMFGVNGLSISIGVTTLILLVFGEVTPKTLAIHNSERLSYLFSKPLYFFSRLISPFLTLATKICNGVISLLHIEMRREPTLTEEEFKTIMEVGQRHGVVGKNEKEMVLSVLELTTTIAQEVMVPRTDIKAVAFHWDMEKIKNFVSQARHSKIPVYKDSYDNIIGMVSTKDLFLESGSSLVDMVKPVVFVPPTKKIDELLQDFYRQKSKMAIVIDEYGGTSGLVTLEDILEEVFGEIYDEFEVGEKLVELCADGRYKISGKTPVYQVNEDCNLSIAPGDYETIAGFLLHAFGKIPVEGERIKAANATFIIEKVVGRRIKSIILELK
ncbi:MAG: hemolysin family protein [Candidatus Omnitrophota bacterium]